MNQKILGDKPKHNFDDNLADVVNEIFDKKPDVEPQKDENTPESYKRRNIIVRNPSYQQKTAEEWIKHYKEDVAALNLSFASMPAIYETFKTYKRWSENKSANTKGIENAINELKKTFTDRHKLLTSTKLEYYRVSLFPTQCSITHYAGFEILKETKSPNYVERASLWSLVQNTHGLEFLRALFDTEDSAKEIMDVWGWVAFSMASQIFVQLPHKSDIPNSVDVCFEAYATLEVAQCLYSPDYTLIINLEQSPKTKGCARGVLTP